MLDFYFTTDDRTKPNDPDGDLEFAGSLDLKVFDRLVRKGLIDNKFNYHSDFYLDEMLLKQMRQNIEHKQILADTDVIHLFHLIDSALSKQCGLIAFGD